MRIHFWGVRGSLPTPLTPNQIQAKISAAIQLAQPKNLESEDARERFIASLPRWIYGTVGGNTACVELTSEKGTRLIFDAGTGIRVLGKQGARSADGRYHLLFSHFHWDHIQGLPFFDAAYNPGNTLDIYSPFEGQRDFLSGQMRAPYYPVDMSALTRNLSFHALREGEEFSIGELRINTRRLKHPGNSYAYSVIGDGRKFIYATDVELTSRDFDKAGGQEEFFEGADMLILDSQYTVEEAYHKENWGHSAFCYAVDFAVTWGIKNLYLFHHEPTYDDQKISSILQAARWYADYSADKRVQVHLAAEDQEVKL